MSAPDPFLLAKALDWLGGRPRRRHCHRHSDLGLGAAAGGQPAPDRCRRQFPGLGVGRLCRGRGHHRSGRRDRHRPAEGARIRRRGRYGLEGGSGLRRRRSASSSRSSRRHSPGGVLPRLVARCRSTPPGGAGDAILPPARGASLMRRASVGQDLAPALDDAFRRDKSVARRGDATARSSSMCSIRRCGSSSSAPCMWRSRWCRWPGRLAMTW